MKFRGIEINVISQFDICKLPEFAATTSNNSDPLRQTGSEPLYPIAACSVPIYPGSQIWFEYTIDGPHPTGAVYFFKLTINEVVVTNWDCTAKQGFHGKMMYNLLSGSRGEVTRQALRFGDGIGDGDGEDIAQINVYRVEKRVRIKNIEEGIGKVVIKTAKADGLQLSNSGLLEPGNRPRRYKYQLLDPIDMPYAAFRFYSRSVEYLETHRVAPLRDCNSPPSARSSMDSQSSGNVELVPTPTQSTIRDQFYQDPDLLECSPSENITNTSPSKVASANNSAEQKDAFAVKTSQSFSQLHLSGSDDSLSVITRDSVEDLLSSVTRFPRSPPSKSFKKAIDSEVPPSPTRSPQLQRRRLVENLTIANNESNLEVEGKNRALGPFTGGGFLRKTSGPPRTAPASVTEFGPTIEEEVKAKMEEEKPDMEPKAQRGTLRTTAEERGGKKLIGFLSRRFAGDNDNRTKTSDASR